MNRKGKKSHLTRGKGTPTKTKRQALSNSPTKSNSAVATKSDKPNQKKSSEKSPRVIKFPRHQSKKSRSPLW
ncbi:MAG: hypothetical protein AAF298_28505, partial [Cyanobacteria bacterium P01_A01_bin.40]